MRDVVGYEGLYAVTEDGQVWSYHSKRFLAQQLQKGYYHVHLSKNGLAKYVSTHRIVAKAYVENPNPEKYTVVNHKDENPLNNHKDNLEWCTVNYNNKYGTRNERSSESNKNSTAQGYSVRCIETQKTYHSIAEASRDTGIYANGISKVCKGEKETVKGFHWEYIDNTTNKRAKPVPVICLTTGKIYSNASEASKDTGINSSVILKICKKQRKTAKGLRWDYYKTQ